MISLEMRSCCETAEDENTGAAEDENTKEGLLKNFAGRLLAWCISCCCCCWYLMASVFLLALFWVALLCCCVSCWRCCWRLHDSRLA